MDTGSSISCLSEQWFQENKIDLRHYEELPATNVKIKIAAGLKTKKV